MATGHGIGAVAQASHIPGKGGGDRKHKRGSRRGGRK